MPHMNMKYLRSFLAFVEDRSSAKAALRLDISRYNIAPMSPLSKGWPAGNRSKRGCARFRPARPRERN